MAACHGLVEFVLTRRMPLVRDETVYTRSLSVRRLLETGVTVLLRPTADG
jgi:hypothetical protein